MKMIYEFTFELERGGSSSPASIKLQAAGSNVTEAFQSALDEAGMSVEGMTGDVSFETVGYAPTVELSPR